MSNWEFFKYKTRKRAEELLDKASYYLYKDEETNPEKNLAEYLERRRCGGS